MPWLRLQRLTPARRGGGLRLLCDDCIATSPLLTTRQYVVQIQRKRKAIGNDTSNTSDQQDILEAAMPNRIKMQLEGSQGTLRLLCRRPAEPPRQRPGSSHVATKHGADGQRCSGLDQGEPRNLSARVRVCQVSHLQQGHPAHDSNRANSGIAKYQLNTAKYGHKKNLLQHLR